MRAKPGRPDLRDYAGYFDVPAAAPDSALTVTWAGVTTLLIDDGASALMTDGFFSRPSLASVGLRRISPSPPRIDGCLARLGVDRLEAVLPVHTHYDHAMDSAVVAERTGARMVGGTSAVQVGRGHGLRRGPLGRRHVRRTDHAGGLRRHAGGVRTLSARPLPGRDHRAGRPAGEGIGLQVRRGMVDACTPPAHRPSAADRGKRRVRPRRVGRAPRRRGVPRRRAAGAAARALPGRLLGRNRARRRRPPRRR